jgi:hypothetical protein
MSRFRMSDTERPVRRATRNGEVLTIAQVNDRIVALGDELGRQQPALEALLAEQQGVQLEYGIRYAAAVLASEARSEDRRKAEAEIAMTQVYLDDDDVHSLAERRSVLDMRVRAQREAMHNLRAQISGLQSVGSNLRTEAGLGGLRT